ncbi:hypothetical protein M405DRAFT_843801 [Rhizopogon salebrosus TDB-379]|nr:hypothetical protein M405DRAFT_843801 [Rhizopogon salebrosus TDB-379]
MSVFNDPAFSSDPRVHPHFPLTNASSYKDFPSKSPVMIINDLTHTPPDTPSDPSPHQEVLPVEHPGFISHSPQFEGAHSSSATTSTCVSLDSDSHTAFSAFTSPTVSSATSHSHWQAHPKTSRVSSHVSPMELSFTSQELTSPCHDPRPSPAMSPPTSDRPIPKRNTSAPEQHVKQVKPPTKRFQTAPVHADGSNRPEGKRRMMNLMRRLTSSRVLSRIDEIEEADPFEAVGSNLARLGPAHMYNDIDILRGDLYSKSKRENVSRPVRTQKVSHTGANGPSQSVVPGQILHHSPGDIISPSPHITQPNPVNDHKPGKGQAKPSHSQPPPYHLIDLPSHAPANYSSPPPHQIHRFGGDIPHRQLYSQPDHDELAPRAPYPLNQQSVPVLPPAHKEEYPGTLSSSRRDTNQGTLPSLPIIEPPAGQGIDLAPDFPRHRSTRSLDSSRTYTTRSTQSTSRTQNNLHPPRNHHLPKRLVMPAPLQQQPQQQPMYPQAHSYDHYADLDPFPLPDFPAHDPPAMYNQSRKLLRKKTAVFPGNVPLPTHAPVQVDTIPALKKHASISFTDAGEVKEGIRRRRLSKLSKRKHDA